MLFGPYPEVAAVGAPNQLATSVLSNVAVCRTKRLSATDQTNISLSSNILRAQLIFSPLPSLPTGSPLSIKLSPRVSRSRRGHGGKSAYGIRAASLSSAVFIGSRLDGLSPGTMRAVKDLIDDVFSAAPVRLVCIRPCDSRLCR